MENLNQFFYEVNNDIETYRNSKMGSNIGTLGV